jgi:integrase
MPKKAKELSDAQVRRLAKQAGFHAVGGVAGLHLQVKPPAASWVLKKKVGSRRREYGLGGYPDTTLSRAREKSREYVESLNEGIDPLVQKAARKSALLVSQAKQRTFSDVAAQFITKKSKEYKTAIQTDKLKHRIETYAYPYIGNMIVGDIDRTNIIKMLKPIWETKTETATRVRANVERILDLAGVEGLRTGDNPARWKGNLELTLPLPSKVSKVEHFKALPLQDMRVFMQKLIAQDWMGAKALRFGILTAARSGEIRAAKWDEINLGAKVWTVPAERMKGGRVHKVPLCADVVVLLKSLPRDSEYIFHNTKGGKLSDVTISKVPKRIGYDVTAHGFRATFRTWAQEHTSYHEEVPELALAHINSDRTRAAYARSELLDKRRDLMDDWEHFCYHGLKKGEVVPMRRGKA